MKPHGLLLNQSPQMPQPLLCRTQCPYCPSPHSHLSLPNGALFVPGVHSYCSVIEVQSQCSLHLHLYFFPNTCFFEEIIITRAKGNRKAEVMSSQIWKSFSFGPHSTIIFSLLDAVNYSTPAYVSHGVCPRCQDTTCHPGEQKPSVHSALPIPDVQDLGKVFPLSQRVTWTRHLDGTVRPMGALLLY